MSDGRLPNEAGRRRSRRRAAIAFVAVILASGALRLLGILPVGDLAGLLGWVVTLIVASALAWLAYEGRV